jgi:amino acid adenylation domain-containing protein
LHLLYGWPCPEGACAWTGCIPVASRSRNDERPPAIVPGLRELIDHAAPRTASGATPSDFPLVSLDQESVDQISAQYPDFETILPVSPLQQGLLIQTLRSPGDGAYIEQFSSTFEGRFDVEALHRAWQLILDRHEQLRAAFVWRDDQPIQVVVRKADLPWEFEDWTALSPEDQAARFEARLADERTRGFDLSIAPAMRCSVTRLADRLHRITWSFHHILLDGWSVQLVLRDVTAAFDGLRGGREVVLPPAPAYREYLAWVRQQDRQSAEHFWKETLNGLEEPTRLSLPVPEYPLPAYDSHWVELPEALTEQLSATGREQQLTMATIVEGAWAMLLARYTSKSDIVFGVTVAGRPPVVAGVQEMVGLFINTLPMRLRISDDATTLSLLQQLQARQLAMRDFEYAQLGEVQRWAGISNAEALFDTMLAFENYPIRRGVGRGDSELTLVDVHVVEQTHYPLTVVVVPGRSLKLRIGYDQQRYERATVERMGRHLTRVFEQIATDISAVFGTSTLAEENECRRIAAFETGLRAPYDNETIAALFARQAASRPGEIALRADGLSLTYGELDRRSNQLARYLRARGVGPDVPVGVCLTGGFDLIVALLGVVKAGGAYLALDPGYPSARLTLMIAETGAPFVITSGELGGQLETSASLISMDRERSVIEAESFDPIAAEATADHLAYICYTSGSTGQPKGVSVPHRAIVRLLFGADYAHFGPDETWLQLAPVPFDASTLEIWGALLHGGRLVLASDRMPAPQALGDLLTSEGVTSIWLTASLYNTVIDAAPEALAGLRQLLIGGEALSIAHVQRGLETLPQTRIINGYGPTEGTTFTCCHPIAASSGTRPIPIGRPISNTTVYILDAGMLRVPIGVAGELYIGGDGLARGYAGQAARTAERFVPDPFSQRPGQRLYRTGDLVRWTDDGLIDFLGRNDSQVKIRGFRIELGEIEAVLESHYAVRAAVVIVRQDVSGVKRLVAYIVAPSMPDEIELSRHLRSRLPDYMVPAAFVRLDNLPLTPNGKIDRDALPEPDAVRAPVSRRPESDAEIAIARIWAAVLQTPEIGADENFFDLGGDSILGIQICARATRAGWHITPKQLFEHQSVAALAAVAKKLAATSPTVSASDASGVCPLLPIQRWFFEQDLPDAHHFNQSMMLTVEADMPASIIEQALAAVVTHHDALRARFTKSADGWSVRIGPSQNSGPLLNRVVLSGADVAAPAAAIGRAAAALQTSLDLQQGPLVRATLFEGPRQPRLLIVIHHLVVDTVSWRILLEDLETACEQGLRRSNDRICPPRPRPCGSGPSCPTAYADSRRSTVPAPGGDPSPEARAPSADRLSRRPGREHGQGGCAHLGDSQPGRDRGARSGRSANVSDANQRRAADGARSGDGAVDAQPVAARRSRRTRPRTVVRRRTGQSNRRVVYDDRPDPPQAAESGQRGRRAPVDQGATAFDRRRHADLRSAALRQLRADAESDAREPARRARIQLSRTIGARFGERSLRSGTGVDWTDGESAPAPASYPGRRRSHRGRPAALRLVLLPAHPQPLDDRRPRAALCRRAQSDHRVLVRRGGGAFHAFRLPAGQDRTADDRFVVGSIPGPGR